MARPSFAMPEKRRKSVPETDFFDQKKWAVLFHHFILHKTGIRIDSHIGLSDCPEEVTCYVDKTVYLY